MIDSPNNRSAIETRQPRLRFIQPSLALLLTLVMSCWTLPGHTEANGGYYQVEIMVFKRLQPAPSPVSLNLGRPRYARNSFTIAPMQQSDTLPQLLSQTRDLASVIETAKAAQPPEQQFLFADKDSADYNRRQLERTKINNTISEDLPRRQHDLNQRLTSIFSDQARIYTSLPLAARMLNPQTRSIRRSSGFRLLHHEAWIQPIGSANKSILIQAGEQYGDAFELDGTIALRVSRYLHVETHLWLTSFQRIAADTPLSQFPQQPERYKNLLLAESRRNAFITEQAFLLRQSRRMRSGETHYLDHPRFGLLVHVKPHQLTEESG